MLHSHSLICAVTLALAGCIIGCGANIQNPPVKAPADLKAPVSDMDKMKAELAKMDPEDAASAEKQHFCPVSEKMLGTMGPPRKVDIDGQAVWICCEGCREELLAEKDKYLAKLNKE